VLNISTHTPTEPWFSANGEYEAMKEEVSRRILDALRAQLPGFAQAEIHVAFPATPVSWEGWVHRYRGRVGGIPQSMDRSLWDWTPAQTPIPGLYMCGDTVYPGQGIPGVTLGGINVYLRVQRTHPN
jgi:phytoene dehydrogenase-like protein